MHYDQYILMLTGLATAQVYGVKCGTKEAKKMQGKLIIMNLQYSAKSLYVDGNWELVTVIEAISASGNVHHPTILLKRKTLQGCWLIHIPGASYGNMERGWTSDEEAMTWLEGFIKSTQL